MTTALERTIREERVFSEVSNSILFDVSPKQLSFYQTHFTFITSQNWTLENATQFQKVVAQKDPKDYELKGFQSMKLFDARWYISWRCSNTLEKEKEKK